MHEPGFMQPGQPVRDVAGRVDVAGNLRFGPRSLFVAVDEKSEDRPIEAGELLGPPELGLRVHGN